MKEYVIPEFFEKQSTQKVKAIREKYPGSSYSLYKPRFPPTREGQKY